MTKNNPIKECDGCCQRKTCNHNLEKCCYLVGRKCIIKEARKYAEPNNQ